MGSKFCNSCQQEKSLEKFYKSKDKKDGVTTQCRNCILERQKVYYEDNKEICRNRHRKYYENNKEYLNEKSKEWKNENRDRINENAREWRKRNPQRAYETGRKWREENRERQLDNQRRWYQENKEYANSKNKEWYENNKERKAQTTLEYKRWRRSFDPDFKLAEVIRESLRRVLKLNGEQKNCSTFELLGYSTEKLRKRLEYQFKDGMSWENYGEWEIDHIISVDYFLKKGETRPHIINALSNLQPLWASENKKKNSKFYKDYELSKG